MQNGISKIQNQAEANGIIIWVFEVEGTNPIVLTQFYTHLYRSFHSPNVCSDVNGNIWEQDFRVHKSRSKHYTSLVIGIRIVHNKFNYYPCLIRRASAYIVFPSIV